MIKRTHMHNTHTHTHARTHTLTNKHTSTHTRIMLVINIHLEEPKPSLHYSSLQSTKPKPSYDIQQNIIFLPNMLSVISERLYMVAIIYCTSYTAICTPACQNNGTCSSPGVCNCTDEWSGVRCGDRKLNNWL